MHAFPRAPSLCIWAQQLKLHADRFEGVNAISGYTRTSVTINGQVWTSGVIVPARGEPLPWGATSAAELDAGHFDDVIARRPELVLLGSGTLMRFAPPAALRLLMQSRIGVETMDTAAACRTFNILVGEGRDVVAALIVGP